MGEHCRVAERDAMAYARDELVERPTVQEADLVEPATSPTGGWALELLIARSSGGVPPVVQTSLAEHGLTVRAVDRRADCWRALAVS